MQATKNKEHWENWAQKFQSNLRATTKNSAFKEIEINYLISAIEKYAPQKNCKILECGCGNGFNLIEVSKSFPAFTCTGFDFVQSMVENAEKNKQEVEKGISETLKLDFVVGDLREPEKVGKGFDIIFTNRAIINLSSISEQQECLTKLTKMLNPDGVLIMLENSINTYSKQNMLREKIELKKRTSAEFNVFLEEDKIIEAVENNGLKLQTLKNIGSLHDVILYVLLPKLTGESDNYGHPLIEIAKNLEINYQGSMNENHFGDFGQVNLFVFK